MRPTRMTPEDSAFWKMESNVSRMHSVALATFAGPAPSHAELREHVAARIPLVPRFRQRVVEIPFDLGRPLWVDDPDFDLGDHLVTTKARGGMASLNELVSIIVSEQLDREQPLWQLTIVTDLPDERWAIVSKVHHSMIDGLFGTEPLAVLVDGAVPHPPMVPEWNPSPPPAANRLVGQTLAELALNPAEQYRLARSRARWTQRRWEKALGQRSTTAPADPTGLRGPVGAARTWTSLTVPFDAVREARRRADASTHDLILAMVTTGIRDLLLARDESTTGWPTVRAIVPLAVADTSAGFQGGVKAEAVELPATERDLATRVQRLREQAERAESNPVTIDAQVGMTGFAAPALASLGLREATRRGVTEGEVHTVIVNVAGPRDELTLLGRPMIRIHPVMPLAAGVRLSIGVISYHDELTFGITSDRDSLPDAHVVANGIRRALAELSEQDLED